MNYMDGYSRGNNQSQLDCVRAFSKANTKRLNDCGLTDEYDQINASASDRLTGDDVENEWRANHRGKFAAKSSEHETGDSFENITSEMKNIAVTDETVGSDKDELDKLRNVEHFSLKEAFKDVEEDIEKDVHKSIV